MKSPSARDCRNNDSTLGEILAAHGGTAGILRDYAPASLNWPGVDAVVVSTDNTLT